jgi:hypothetical protein
MNWLQRRLEQFHIAGGRLHLICVTMLTVGRVATELRDGESGDRIPVGARFSAPVQTGPGAHQASCTMGTGSFSGIGSGQGVMLTPHPLLVPWSKKRSRAIPLLSLRAFVACKKGETYLLTYWLGHPHTFSIVKFGVRTWPCWKWEGVPASTCSSGLTYLNPYTHLRL